MSTLPRSTFSGADWLRSALDAHHGNLRSGRTRPRRGAPTVRSSEISELGALVADILGAAYRGLYHLDDRRLMEMDWSDKDRIFLTLGQGQELATYDGPELTVLAVLCHDASVRLAVCGHGMNRLALSFHRRTVNAPSLWGRHWSIEAAVEYVRTKLFDARPRAASEPAVDAGSGPEWVRGAPPRATHEPGILPTRGAILASGPAPSADEEGA